MLTNTKNVDRYLINGTPLATYSISFPYWDKDEIKVYLTQADGTLATLTEGTNYTLSAPNGNNGTLTRVGDWTAGATNLTIVREMSLTQEVDLRNGDKIDAETLETALDDLTAQVQQLAEAQERSVVSSIDEAGASLTIPNAAERAGSGSGTLMGFGANGDTIALRDLAQFDADVQSASDDAAAARGYATASFNSKELSKDWATSNSIVESTDYSAKKYAQDSKSYADIVSAHATQIDDIAADLTNLDTVAADIADVSTVAGDIAKVTAVADDLTNIDAVNANKTNIDTVAADSANISTVASNIFEVYNVSFNMINVNKVAAIDDDVTDVAGIKADVSTVAGISADVTTVAGATSDIAAILPDVADVSAVAGDLTKVTAVADDLTNIDAVNANKTNIDTVVGISSDVTTVAGISANVTTVAGISSDVSAVAAVDSDVTTVAGISSDVAALGPVASDVAAVAAELTDLGTVATNISDVAAVGGDIAKVTAVADDLTNIDAVADDLTNIDNAITYASLSRQYAEGKKLDGTDVVSGEAGYEDNAKYYKGQIQSSLDKIDSNTARIENIEQKFIDPGDIIEVSYPDDGTYTSLMPDKVPAGMAKNAVVKSIVGKSRARNQLINLSVTYLKTINTSGTWVDNKYTRYGIDFVVDEANGTVTVSGSAGGNAEFWLALHPFQNADKFLLAGAPSNSSNDINLQFTDYLSESKKDTGSGILDTAYTNAESKVQIFVRSGQTISPAMVFRPVLRDLTRFFPEGVPSTVAECVAKCPSILEYDAYGYSIVNTTVEGVKSESRNLLDPAKLNGAGTWNDGVLTSTAGALFDFTNVEGWSGIEFLPYARYYLKVTASVGSGVTSLRLQVNYTDGTTQTSSSVSGGGTLDLTLLSAEGKTVKNVLFNYSSGVGGTVQLSEFIINVSDSQDGTFTTYWPPVTLSLPQSVTLRSAGSVAEVYDLETGKVSHPIESYTFTGSEIWVSYASGYQSICLPKNAKSIAGSATPEMITDIALDVTSRNVIANGTAGISVHEGSVFISDTSFATSGKTINYVLATPDPDTDEGIVNNPFTKTEGRGTINTIQTQTTQIDNCLDVGYLAL